MIGIKIYGTGTPGYQLAKSKLATSLNDAGVEYTLEEENEINAFIKDDVLSVPAIKVNNNVLFELKQNGSYNQSLRETIQTILKMEKYGNLTKIIVPTDFSESSFNAYNYAHHLAKDLAGILLITHVYYPTSTDVNQVAVINEHVEEIHRDKLDKFVQSVNQDWIGNFVSEPLTEGVFKVGFPKMELIEMSKMENSILVMGTTGSGDAFKKIFGSLSLDMVDNCHCPLLLIHPGITYSKPEELIYLSENLKNDSLHLLYVGRLCEKLGSALKLVHFRKKENDDYDVSDSIGLIESYFPNLKYHIEINDTEDIFDSIKTTVLSPQHNIVVMSTKHRNVFQGIFHKSATEFAALNSTSPLLILSDHSE